MAAPPLWSVSQRALATYGLTGATLQDLRVEAPLHLRLDTVTLATSDTPNIVNVGANGIDGVNGGDGGNGQPTVIMVTAFGPAFSLQVIPNDNNGGLGGVGGSPRGSSGASGAAGGPATVTMALVS